MDKHDELCEKADVGSLCDCHCAGSKHAIKHTKGGVPGAGAVSKRAQGIASKDGRAAVVNNRAAKADPGVTAAGVKVGPGDISKGSPGQQRSMSDLQKRFPTAKPVGNDLNEGDRVTHKWHGVGTVKQAGNHGGNTVVKFDNGETHPVMQHDMMHGAHTEKGAGGSSMTAKQIEQRDQARDSRLNHSQGRRARVDELAPLSREQFDALPPAEQQRAVADLRRVAESGDVRSTRDRMGIAGKVDQNHIGRAKDLLRRFTAAARPAPAAKAPVVDRFAAEVKSPRDIEGFLKGLDRAELVALGDAHGSLSGSDRTSKLAYLRKFVASGASDELRKREKAADAGKGITSGGQGGPDAARRDVMAVTSRRRNGDTTAEAVAKPGPPAPGDGRDKSETVKSTTRGGDVVEHTAPAGRETQAVREAVAGITNQVGGDAAAAAYAKLTPADWGKLSPGQRHDIAEQIIANANNDEIRMTSPLGKNVAKARATLAGLPADAKRGTPVDRHHSPVGVGDVVTHETRGRGVVTLDAGGQQAVSFDNSPGARRVPHDELKHGAPLTGPTGAADRRRGR